MIRMMKMKIFHSTSGHEALGSQGPSTVLAKGTRDPAYFQMWGERQITRGTAEAEKIREGVDTIDYNEKLVYEEKIKEDSKLSGNPPYLEGGGRSVAVLYAPSGTTTTASCSMRAAVLGGKQQQHHSLPSVGARPCSRAGAPRVSSRSSRGTATTLVWSSWNLRQEATLARPPWADESPRRRGPSCRSTRRRS